MRPEALFPLFAPVTALSGVGPRIGALIARVAGGHVVDLCWHLPIGLIDRRFAPKVADAPAGQIATLTVRVEGHLTPRNPRLPYKVRCSDETGALDLVFFHAQTDYLQRVLPVGEVRVVSGKVEHFRNEVQITHPDHIASLEEVDRLKAVEPVYRLTAGLTPKTLARAVRAALARGQVFVDAHRHRRDRAGGSIRHPRREAAVDQPGGQMPTKVDDMGARYLFDQRGDAHFP